MADIKEFANRYISQTVNINEHFVKNNYCGQLTSLVKMANSFSEFDGYYTNLPSEEKQGYAQQLEKRLTENLLNNVNNILSIEKLEKTENEKKYDLDTVDKINKFTCIQLLHAIAIDYSHVNESFKVWYITHEITTWIKDLLFNAISGFLDTPTNVNGYREACSQIAPDFLRKIEKHRYPITEQDDFIFYCGICLYEIWQLYDLPQIRFNAAAQEEKKSQISKISSTKTKEDAYNIVVSVQKHVIATYSGLDIKNIPIYDKGRVFDIVPPHVDLNDMSNPHIRTLFVHLTIENDIITRARKYITYMHKEMFKRVEYATITNDRREIIESTFQDRKKSIVSIVSQFVEKDISYNDLPTEIENTVTRMNVHYDSFMNIVCTVESKTDSSDQLPQKKQKMTTLAMPSVDTSVPTSLPEMYQLTHSILTSYGIGIQLYIATRSFMACLCRITKLDKRDDDVKPTELPKKKIAEKNFVSDDIQNPFQETNPGEVIFDNIFSIAQRSGQILRMIYSLTSALDKNIRQVQDVLSTITLKTFDNLDIVNVKELSKSGSHLISVVRRALTLRDIRIYGGENSQSGVLEFEYISVFGHLIRYTETKASYAPLLNIAKMLRTSMKDFLYLIAPTTSTQIGDKPIEANPQIVDRLFSTNPDALKVFENFVKLPKLVSTVGEIRDTKLNEILSIQFGDAISQDEIKNKANEYSYPNDLKSIKRSEIDRYLKQMNVYERNDSVKSKQQTEVFLPIFVVADVPVTKARLPFDQVDINHIAITNVLLEISGHIIIYLDSLWDLAKILTAADVAYDSSTVELPVQDLRDYRLSILAAVNIIEEIKKQIEDIRDYITSTMFNLEPSDINLLDIKSITGSVPLGTFLIIADGRVGNNGNIVDDLIYQRGRSRFIDKFSHLCNQMNKFEPMLLTVAHIISKLRVRYVKYSLHGFDLNITKHTEEIQLEHLTLNYRNLLETPELSKLWEKMSVMDRSNTYAKKLSDMMSMTVDRVVNDKLADLLTPELRLVKSASNLTEALIQMGPLMCSYFGSMFNSLFAPDLEMKKLGVKFVYQIDFEIGRIATESTTVQDAQTILYVFAVQKIAREKVTKTERLIYLDSISPNTINIQEYRAILDEKEEIKIWLDQYLQKEKEMRDMVKNDIIQIDALFVGDPLLERDQKALLKTIRDMFEIYKSTISSIITIDTMMENIDTVLYLEPNLIISNDAFPYAAIQSFWETIVCFLWWFSSSDIATKKKILIQ